MELKVFAVYDVKSQIYFQPRYYHSRPHAVRMFTVEHVNDKSIIGMFPGDFHIMEIGTWDDQTCITKHLDKAILVCTVEDLLEDKNRMLEGIQNETQESNG